MTDGWNLLRVVSSGGLWPSGSASTVLAVSVSINKIWVEIHTSEVISAVHMKRALTTLDTFTVNIGKFRFVYLRFSSDLIVLSFW